MNNLQEFKITKLFGYKNVHLKFNNDILILMGENGTGKTSILNALYFTLTRRWEKLLKINFNAISIKLDDKEYSFSQDVLNSFNDMIKDEDISLRKDILYKIFENIDFNELKKIIEFEVKAIQNELYDIRPIIHNYLIRNGYHLKFEISIRHLVEIVYSFCKDNKFNSLYEFVKCSFNIPILYFPTYRRVEEELQNLGRFDVDRYRRRLFIEDREQESLEEETLIQFGMRDVEERIKKKILEINDSSVRGFSQVTGQILRQLQKGGLPNKIDVTKIKKEDIQIILNRIKNRNLPKSDKEDILRSLELGEIQSNPQLGYFLIKLQEIYAEQKELDDAIKGFRDVVNQYLVDKEFIFDESEVTLKIFNKNNRKEVKLNQLSSGEKQIVSLFSKIYLEKNNDFMVLFDEPELSLSIKWQRQLLPHIVNSKKCAFLLAVTHSPFIFDNELEDYTIGLNTFID